MKNPAWLSVALLIIAAVIFGAVFVYRQGLAPVPAGAPQAGPQMTATAPIGSVEVDLTDQGFSPSTITIKSGQTVHFVNKQSLQSSPGAAGLKSSGQMWVASNPHPTHTDYPGFDQLQSADTYDFTFIRTGTFGYHNHLNPAIGGTINVTD